MELTLGATERREIWGVLLAALPVRLRCEELLDRIDRSPEQYAAEIVPLRGAVYAIVRVAITVGCLRPLPYAPARQILVTAAWPL